MPVQFDNQIQYSYAPAKKKSRFTNQQLILVLISCVILTALVIWKMPRTNNDLPSPVPSNYIPPDVIDGKA